MNGFYARTWAAAAALGILTVQAFGQIVPLNFGSATNMVDEFGQMLEGSASAPGDLVQILNGNKGVFPPATNGAPHADNPVITTAKVGEGIASSAGAIGKVSGNIRELANRGSPNNTNAIFARVFNASTLEGASFYTDSSLFDVPVYGDLYDVFYIDAQATDSALDETDHDGDGLNRSWEISYGTNPGNPDSDGDGVNDGHEILANTDANDDGDFLHMVELIPMGGGDLAVMWDASPGTTYQVEYTTNQLTDTVAFAPINPLVTATGNTAYTIVTNGTFPEFGTSFRARVPQD